MFRLKSPFFTLLSMALLTASACGKSTDNGGNSGDGDGDAGDGDAGDGDAGDGDAGDGDAGDGDGDGGDGDLGDGDIGDGDVGDGDLGGGGIGGMGGAPAAPRRLVIVEGLDEPTGIAVDEQYVYFADRLAGHVARCPLDGCDGQPPELVIDGLQAPSGIHLSGTTLYLTSSHTGDRQIFGCQVDDCASSLTALATLGGGGHEFIDVTEREGTLYYGNWPLFGSCSADGCIDSGLTPFGGAPVVSVATDQDYLYSARHGWGQVSRCALPDCTDLTVLVEVETPLGLAVVEDLLYFGQHNVNGLFAGGAGGQWGIYSCSTDGCDFEDARVVEYGEISPYALAIWGDYLYFTNVKHGTVVRVER